VGFAIGDAELIEGLDRVKNSFNSYPIDRIAEKAAIAALNDTAHFDECRDKIIATRENITQELQQLGFEVLPSQANFVFAKPTTMDAETIFTKLREKKIIVRYFNKPRIRHYLRITIGTDEEMEALMEALREILDNN
jgi:histidinol-phosphate aminotransferase